jgi:hypothetical protein
LEEIIILDYRLQITEQIKGLTGYWRYLSVLSLCRVHCESRVSMDDARGQFEKPRESESSTVGRPYQRTGEETSNIQDTLRGTGRQIVVSGRPVWVLDVRLTKQPRYIFLL